PMTGLLGQVAYPQLAWQFEKQERRLVYRGQKAILRLHAFPDRELHGHVKQVAELPAQYDRLMADVRAYKTQIAIDEPLDGLRPGMTAEATILTEEAREHVLTVPVSAVVGTGHPGATDKCFVLTAEGPQERDIVVGTTDEKVIEIRSGLHEGDEVVLNPRTIKDEPEESQAAGCGAVGVPP